MSRIKSGTTTHKRHKKILNQVKGHRLARSKHLKVAKEQVLHQGQYAYAGRRLRKRDFRRLWISRITASLASLHKAPSYSVFIKLLKDKHISLNRKMLSEISLNDPDGFQTIVQQVWHQPAS